MIGKRNRRIELQREVVTSTGGMGEEIYEWQTYARPWVAMRPLRGNERWQSQQAQAEVDGEIRMSYRPDVRAVDRVIYRDPAQDKKRVFKIEAIMHPDDNRRETHLLVKEVIE